jgi:hypothetical protein
MTNNDGLWRYRLNDIVQVAGFTPADGIPLIRYVERRGYVEEFLFQAYFLFTSLLIE